MAEQGPGRGFGEGTQYLAAAMRFAGAVVMFLFGGLALDRWIKTTPLFTIAGALLGAVLGFLSVYREMMAGMNRQETQKPQADEKPWSSEKPSSKQQDSDSP